ncbi:methyltransferase domain-containing protein [Gallaecimonas mangrovi]|uniref:methyltransferase domain-containing protein n=1 Tax=Gallaecimonas mangrovi TaxID=2291597 RepID=UPI000E20194C|nr:methyltransferase domain-containing protein [Gallaecimonas mangrovi]
MALANVARAFGSAAQHYDSRAALQQQVGDWLLAALPVAATQVLDIGCGTGHCLARVNAERRWGLDLSAAMLAQTAGKVPDAMLIQADAEQLPFAEGSLDLVVSNLAMQWCPNLQKALNEVARVLSLGGQATITLPLAGSLQELANAWGQGQGHLLTMPDEAAVKLAMPLGARLDVKEFVVHFADLKALRQSLKGVGAHHVPERAKGLTGKTQYHNFVAAMEAQRVALGLPLTYRVGLISWQNAFL